MIHWIEENVKALENLFIRLEKEIEEFQKNSRLQCLPGCARCCRFPEIEATVLEFLPLALHLYRKGSACQIIEHQGEYCQLFLPVREKGTWGCGLYPFRGMICRLFGFTATLTKEGKPALAVCREIKQAFPDWENRLPVKIPLIRDYTNALEEINPGLGREHFPIREAIRRAVSLVSFTLGYRDQE